MAQYAPGEMIVRQGDPSDAFFVIASGRVEVVCERPGGQDLVLQEMGAGEWFGEIGILLDKPRTATVRAASGSEVEVMVIGKDDFHHLMSESGPTQADVWLMLLRRFSALESALKNSSTEKFE
jgi:CRP-like cAMP-binding protein